MREKGGSNERSHRGKVVKTKPGENPMFLPSILCLAVLITLYG